MEPENFTPVKTLHVFDQTSPINDLNELEVINGDIFANRYHTNQIYIIDSSTGKVKGIIDLSGIFNQSDYNRRIDVLNGIAFNEDSQTYYVTGKYWPKLFEISIVSINNI
jgi:glutamine cyclotransferase